MINLLLVQNACQQRVLGVKLVATGYLRNIFLATSIAVREMSDRLDDLLIFV